MVGRPTPSRFADDLTNRVVAPSSSSSSSRPKRPASYRQTSLADGFFVKAGSPVPSTSSSPLASFAGDVSSTRAADSSSTCATSPSRPHDVDAFGDTLMDEHTSSDAEAPRSVARTSKRRRVASTSRHTTDGVDATASPETRARESWLLSAFDTGALRTERRLPATHSIAAQQFSVFESMRRRDLGQRMISRHVSLRPWLETFVSSNEVDVSRIPSTTDHRHWAPPFAVAYTHASKAGGKKVVAVADEEGTVSLIDGEADQWHAGAARQSFHAHDNAIWDLAWRQDDGALATASGDSTVRLWDAETRSCIGVMRGHGSSVRSVSWDPFNNNLLSTAARDGTIRVWDRRVTGYNNVRPLLGESVGAVNVIKNAHAPKGRTGKGRAPISVTGVVHLQQQENLLASSGSADGVVKIWDLRRSHSRRVNPATYETSEEAAANLETARPHGLSSLKLAPDGRKLYALSTDSSIVAFDPLNLTHETPLTTFHSPLSQHGSFYIRCAISPCSRFLASGSSSGEITLWDTEGTGAASEAVRLRGHEIEVGQVDWAQDSLVSAADDMLVRFWRPNMALARLRSASKASLTDTEAVEAEQAKNRWSGVTNAL